MKRKTQLELLKRKWYEGVSFGGSQNPKGKRKERRPLSTRYGIHMIFKASQNVILLKYGRVHECISEFAFQHNIELKDLVVHINHLHLSIKIKDRASYVRFVRAVSSAIGRMFALQGFWKQLPYTRILKTKAEYINLETYFGKNREQVDRIFGMPVRSDEEPVD